MKKLTIILLFTTLLIGQYAPGDPFVEVNQDTVQFGVNDMYRNCGALFDMNIIQDENTFTVTAIDTGGIAYCHCTFNIHMEVSGISSGDYTAHFFSYDINTSNGVDTVYVGEVSFTVEEDIGDIFSVLSTFQSPCIDIQTGNVIHVPDDYLTIQEGIDAATEGDTVLVAEGTYYENILWPETNGIKLIGEDRETTIIDGNYLSSVIRFEFESENSVIDSTTSISELTLQNGYEYERDGGGIYCSASDPQLINLNIKDNEAHYGAGLYIIDSNPIIQDCMIDSNFAHGSYWVDGEGFGGGIYCEESTPVIINTIIKNNWVARAWSPGFGAGIYLRDCGEASVFQNLIIFNNGVDWGSGAGIFCHDNPSLTFNNVTCYGNMENAFFLQGYNHINVINSILWGGETQTFDFSGSINSTLTVAYSNVQGGLNGIEIDNCTIYWLEGNLDLDPQYVDSGNEDFTLQPISPCIDAGTSFFVWEGDTLVNMTEDEYNGEAPDMGAFESDYDNIYKWYVSTEGSDSNDGSEDSPFLTIQHGIDVATEGDTVLVAEGTYYESISYRDKNIVVGSMFLTTQDTSYIASTIIEGGQGGSVVRFMSNQDSTCVLTGFTIKSVEGSFNRSGIYCTNSSPTMKYLTVTENTNSGIYLWESNPIMKNLVVTGNTSPWRGGGIWCHNSDPTMSNLTVTENTGFDGGGIACISSNPTMTNMTVSNNIADCEGGGIFFMNCIINMSNMTISGNSANTFYGGGIYIWGGSHTMTNMTISGNSAEDYGSGGIHISGGSLTMTNMTITENTGYSYSSGVYFDGNSLTIINTVIANNIGSYGIRIGSGTPTIEYSNFYNNGEGNFWNVGDLIGINTMVNANGDSCDMYFNIQEDPLFTNPTNEDFTLQSNSPCIDAGIDVGLPYLGSAPDMGAYEYEGTNSVEPIDPIPTDFVLKPAYPNPFNPTTTISFDIPHESHVILTVYDLMGRELETLVNTIQPIGNHQITWDASNYSSGVYLVQLISEEYRSVQKLMLIK